MDFDVEADKQREQVAERWRTIFAGFWAEKPAEGTDVHRQWTRYLLQLAAYCTKYLFDEQRDENWIIEWAIQDMFKARGQLGLSLTTQKEAERAAESPVDGAIQSERERLLDKVGTVDFEEAERLVLAGCTHQETRAALRLSAATVSDLRNYFREVYPDAFRCAACDKERGHGQRMYVDDDGELLCFPCKHFIDGDLTERQKAIEAIRCAYNQGFSSEKIADLTGAHWRLVNVALHWDGRIDHCHNCGRKRGPGRQFGPWEYDDGVSRPTCKRCIGRMEKAKVHDAAAVAVA